MKQTIESIDIKLLKFIRRITFPFSRLALFVVFYWFGLLKLVDASPANPLVSDLLRTTLPFISFENFIYGFAIFEMLIGVLFLVPKASRLVLPLLAIHMVTTLLPLIFLPDITWKSFMVPTLEGQYIIKNIVIIATAIGLAAHLHPIAEGKRK